MKRILMLMVVFGFLFSFSTAESVADGPAYMEGQWEITSTMKIPGMPKGMNKPITYKVCMDKKNAVPPMKDRQDTKDDQCEMAEQKVSGNTVTYKIKCKDGTVSKGRITYSKTSFEGDTTTTVKSEGTRTMRIKSVMEGKYLGPCPKK